MICPNCGVPLPDTVTMCYSCKMKFNNPYIQNNKSVQGIIAESIADDKRTIVNIISVVGLIGVLLEFLATFAPIYKIYTNYDSVVESLSDTQSVAIWYWIDAAFLLFFSLPGIKYDKDTGILKVFFGGAGLIGALRMAISLRNWFDEQTFTGVIGSVNFSYQSGMYLLFISFLFTLISGIMLIIYGYDNKKAKKKSAYNIKGIKNNINVSDNESPSQTRNVIIGLIIIIVCILFVYWGGSYNNSLSLTP